MSRRILTEYTSTQLDIGQADTTELSRLGIDVRLDLGGSGVWINPGSTVGVVRLPSGQVLEFRPKVPLRNLLWMLAYANDIPVKFDTTVELAEFPQIFEYIASYFAELVESQIDRGLYRNYVEEEDNLAAVRGKILIADDLRHNLVLRQRIYCRYTSFSWDLPENQVIRQVIQHLAGWGFGPDLARRLRSLDIQLDEVSRVSFSASDIDRFVYNRQSESYRPIHRLCQLFLRASSLSEHAGEIRFDGFLFDMNALFERFVTVALGKALVFPLALQDQYPTTLDSGSRVNMRPDLVIFRSGTAALVADCKYKRLRNDRDFKHHDLYQMLAYTTAMNLATGVLIYPRDAQDIDAKLDVKNSQTIIREVSISLNGTVDELQEEIGRLATSLTRWTRADFPSVLVQAS
jgi:5-methylcytosine-specific restriction enzyme subunit McrC